MTLLTLSVPSSAGHRWPTPLTLRPVFQIYSEAKRFGKVYNVHVVCCYGGGSKWEQSKALEAGAEIVVATPGRRREGGWGRGARERDGVSNRVVRGWERDGAVS